MLDTRKRYLFCNKILFRYLRGKEIINLYLSAKTIKQYYEKH